MTHNYLMSFAKNIKFFIIYFCFATLHLTVHAQTWEWAKGAGQSLNEESNAVATDDSGNVYIAGEFQSSSIIFDTTTLYNASTLGNWDIFLTKYDNTGNVIWAKSAGSSYSESAWSISVDNRSYLYLTGYYASSSITFGSTTLTGGGMYLVKYDNNGNVVWANGEEFSAGASVTYDYEGNIFVTGFFSSDTLIISTDTIANADTSGFYKELFLIKYDSLGNYKWAKSALGNKHDFGRAVATDQSGMIYIAGSFQSDSIIFGNSVLYNSGSSNMFLVKYNTSGQVVWARNIGGTSWDECHSLAVDKQSNVIICGGFASPTININGLTLTNANPPNSADVFLIKFDSTGTAIFANTSGGTSGDVGYVVTTDNNCNIYLKGGFTSSQIVFGTDTLINDTSASSGHQIFVVKFSSNGTVFYSKQISNYNNYTGLKTIAVNNNYDLFLTGSFPDSIITFDTINLSNYYPTRGDIFLAKMRSDDTSIPTQFTNNDLNIYPNPSQGKITITNLNSSHSLRFEIFNLLGKSVFRSQICDSDNFNIDLTSLPRGFYLLKVDDGSKQFINKLILK